MKWNILNQPIGGSMSNGYAPKKEIPIVPILMAAASIASTLISNKKSADANKKAQDKLDAEKRETEAERRLKKYQTWASTASGQNTIRMLNEQADRAYKRIRGLSAVGGTTEAAVAAEKELQNQKIGDVIAQANAAFEDRKEGIDASYRQQLSGLNQQQIALDQQKAANIAQAGAGVSNALMQGAMSSFGGTQLGQSWMNPGSQPGGNVVQTPATTAQPVTPNVQKIGPEMFSHAFGRIPATRRTNWWESMLKYVYPNN